MGHQLHAVKKNSHIGINIIDTVILNGNFHLLNTYHMPSTILSTHLILREPPSHCSHPFPTREEANLHKDHRTAKWQPVFREYHLWHSL